MNRTLLAALGVGLMVGCASPRPPTQLVDARVAYQRATQTPNASAVATDLYDARAALDSAERSFTDDGDSDKTKTLAYVAHRRAIAVEGKAKAVASLESKRMAEAQLQAYREQQATATRMQLDRAKGQLSAAQQAAEAERQARTAADTTTQELLSQIEGLKTEITTRGLMLTLSGSVLFASGKSQLLPTAKRRLGEVAKTLKTDKRAMIIVGHTDSTGGEEMNKRLSEERANAVRLFLVKEGIWTSACARKAWARASQSRRTRARRAAPTTGVWKIILENEAGGVGRMPAGGSMSPPRK